MKKKYLFLLILFMFFVQGCGKYGEKDVINDLSKKIKKCNSYEITGTLEITNNDDTYQYDVVASYEKKDNYRVSLINKANNHEQIILKNKEGVYVVTPELNKSYKFQSDWPNTNSQIYLLSSIIKDIESDKNKSFIENDDNYIIGTKVNYPNNEKLSKQKIYLDKKLNLLKIEVLDDNDITQMIMKFNKIDYKSNYSDNYFNLDSIIDKIEYNEETNETSSLDEIIYPLYIPSGTSLTNKENIDKTDGERVILTFDGEKPFLLVEETSSVESEFSIVPTFGEPYFLTDTIAALTDNSLTWSSNGVDYYIVSDAMSQIELIEIASSITSIPTMK